MPLCGGLPSLPQGSLVPVRVVLSRSINAYYSPMRQSRRHAATSRLCAYTQRLRCAGAPRRPARPSLLSLPCFPCMLPTLPRWSNCAFPLYSHSGSRLPRIISESPTHSARLASYHRRGSPFRGCIVYSRYGLQVCLALLTGYDGMKSYALHRAF